MSSFAQFSAAVVAPVAIRALWQGLAVAALLALALRLTPRLSAAQRFAVWALGFAAAALLPFLPELASRLAAPATVSVGLPASAPRALLQIDPRWSIAIAALWLAVAALRLTALGLQLLRLRALWRSARPVELPQSADRRSVQVCVSDAIDRPSVIGFFAPRVLIPSWLFPRLTTGELEQVVLHETEHLRRHDDWTNLAQKLALALFPLNPALHLIDRRLGREREMACDEAVVRITRAPRAYAACLASMAERNLDRRAAALSLGAFERRPELVDRVHSILRGARTLPPAAAAALLGAVACALAAVSFGLAQCPQLVAFAAPAPQLAAAEPKPIEATPAVAQTDKLAEPAATHRTRVVRPARPTAASVATQPEQLASLRAAARPSAAPANADGQFIVFTAYEQVSSAPTAQAANADGVDAVVSPEPAQRIRVTRLVLRVTPAMAHPDRLAVPFADGWLVLQL